jgi:hypothetical protein
LHESEVLGRAGVEPAIVRDFEFIHNPVLPEADNFPLISLANKGQRNEVSTRREV